MAGIRWTQEEYEAYIRGVAAKDRAAVPVTDLESDSKHGPKTTNVDETVCPRFRLHVHSKRRRLTDPDGVSAKAAIDGLVKGGILRDDSAKYISAVTFSQELSKLDETIIEVWQE
jgi:hypothetical protein